MNQISECLNINFLGDNRGRSYVHKNCTETSIREKSPRLKCAPVVEFIKPSTNRLGGEFTANFFYII